MFNKTNLVVRIKKEDLLKVLKDNREKHAADYDKATAGFRKLLEKELNDKLKAVIGGKQVKLKFKSIKPVSHLNEYDDVIGMIELSTDAEFEINSQQYKQYIKNEWEWERMWFASNVNNLSAT